jgi:zinc D-Ala-D-Ala dipeptidase
MKMLLIARKKAFLVLLAVCFWSSLALAQSPAPPREEGNFRPSKLVELVKLDPTFRLDIRYATPHNFMGRPVYTEARAFLQMPAAEALVRAHGKAKEKGYGLLIFDAYRPWHVTKLFWDTFPQFKDYLADPAKGSRHNRGCAVDLTFFDLKTGKEVEMPSPFDDFTERAHPDYQGGTEPQRKARDLLRTLMESEGFAVYENEWWHFDYEGWREYAIQDVSYSEIGK